MCDYSAHGLPNRLAEEGENLVSQYVGGHATVCFVSVADQATLSKWKENISTVTGKIMHMVKPTTPPMVPLVCIPPGAVLRLSGIPENVQRLAGVKTKECEVVFNQLPPTPHTFLDGVIFPNGKLISLQDLGENVSAHVITLDGATERTVVEERVHAYAR